MTSWVTPTQGGLFMQHGPWKIGIWVQKDFGIGEALALGHETAGGWVVDAVLLGPMSTGQMAQFIKDMGGMGPTLRWLQPTINFHLKKNFDLTPTHPPYTVDTAYTEQDMNYVLAEFMEFRVDAADQVPVFKFKYDA